MALRIVLASGNAHKREELQRALAPLGVELVVLDAPPDPEETGETFVDNALIKARAWVDVSGLPALADDSGLEVDGLGGRPGVYSARFASDRVREPTDSDNNAKLLDLLAEQPQPWTARFRCSLVLLVPAGELAQRLARVGGHEQARILRDGSDVALVSDGTSEGTIIRTPRGASGFGYDPIFLSEDLGVTFAEASAAQKLSVSHRGRAVASLVAVLQQALA